jgi:hypothetical protein
MSTYKQSGIDKKVVERLGLEPCSIFSIISPLSTILLLSVYFYYYYIFCDRLFIPRVNVSRTFRPRSSSRTANPASSHLTTSSTSRIWERTLRVSPMRTSSKSHHLWLLLVTKGLPCCDNKHFLLTRPNSFIPFIFIDSLLDLICTNLVKSQKHITLCNQYHKKVEQY